MGDKVQNRMMLRENGGWGFAIGRRQGPHGPSLDLAPDGRPWTHHIPSPTVEREVMDAIVRAARRSVHPDRWPAEVRAVDAEIAAWLDGLFAAERSGLWEEARSEQGGLR